MTIDAGPHRIELRYHGPNHQDGNIFIDLPRQRVLMLVDVVVPGWVPFHALGGATEVAGYMDAHDAALSYPFDTLVAGHLTRSGTGRLGGAAAFTYSHCLAMTIAFAHEWGVEAGKSAHGRLSTARPSAPALLPRVRGRTPTLPAACS
jgi:hypothetical protein